MHSAARIFAFSAIFATASAGAIGLGIGLSQDIHAYPAYTSTYAVADKLTGDQKSASEVRDGEVTKGSYSVLQPDGILRTVNYIVTPLGGFQAQVINKGVATHPAIIGFGKGISSIGGGPLGIGIGGGRSVVGGLGVGAGGRKGASVVG